MNSLKVKVREREFFYNGTPIPDPAPNLSVEELREILTPTWPRDGNSNARGAGRYWNHTSLHF
jgi:PRTRC genetic system protein C